MPEHFTPRIRHADLSTDCKSRLRRIADELFEIGDAYERTGDESFGRAETWKRRSDLLATVAGVLAATSGIVGLAWESRLVAAVLALTAASISAVLLAFRPIERASHAKSYADACWEISAEVRSMMIDIPEMTLSEARKALARVRTRAHKVSRRSMEIGGNPNS